MQLLRYLTGRSCLNEAAQARSEGTRVQGSLLLLPFLGNARKGSRMPRDKRPAEAKQNQPLLKAQQTLAASKPIKKPPEGGFVLRSETTAASYGLKPAWPSPPH